MAMKEVPDIQDLRSRLRSPAVRKDNKLHLEAVCQVIALSTSGCDMSSLFPEMILAGATANLAQKKLVYLFFTTYAETNSELALLTVNTLTKDCQDQSPLLRSLALRALSSLRLVSLSEFIVEHTVAGLQDESALVRRTAVMAVLKLFHLDQHLVTENKLMPTLYKLLRDSDSQVVSNSLCVLTEILAREGGLVVSTLLAHHLLNRLSDFSEWSTCQILHLLHSYKPSSEQELLDMMNILDHCLGHSSSGVVLGTISMFLHLTKDYPSLVKDVHHRIKAPLLTLLGSGCPEVTYTCLEHIRLLVRCHRVVWSRDYKSFFCRCSDYPYIKCKKIELLADVCIVTTTSAILNELVEHTADGCVSVAIAAIKSIASIGVRLALSSELCVNRLLQLLKSDKEHVFTEALVALSKIALLCDNVIRMIVPYFPMSVLSLSEPEGRAAMIWLLGEIGQDVKTAPYLLEELINNVSLESCSLVKCQLLTSVTKLFFKRAPECQDMLGKLLDYCIDMEEDVNVKDRALLYYRLLRQDVHLAERVVNSKQLIIGLSSSACQPDKLLLSEFNTLAVMYGESSATFISQECPYSVATGPASKGNALHMTSHFNHKANTENTDWQDFPLDPSVQICPNRFESTWLGMTPMKQIEIHLSSLPTCKELTELFYRQQIKTVASTPGDQSVIKMYLYAQHASTWHLFLAEVNVDMETKILSFTLKCQNAKDAQKFTKFFFQCLGTFKRKSPKLQIKRCEDVPSSVKNVKGIFLEETLFLGGGLTESSKADTLVYSYNPTVDMWKVLPTSPLKWFSMGVFHSQLVLVGGKETEPYSMGITNKLALWDRENGQWEFSLPPMMNRRTSPFTFTYNRNLIVTGGSKGVLDYNVELLNSDSLEWQYVRHLPSFCTLSLSTVLNGCWYFYRENDSTLIQICIDKLHGECNKTISNKSGNISPTYSQDSHCSNSSRSMASDFEIYCQAPFTPVQLCNIQGYLAAVRITDKQDSMKTLSVHVYMTEIKRWTHIGDLPYYCLTSSFISVPTGDLFIAGGDSLLPAENIYSKELLMASITTISQ